MKTRQRTFETVLWSLNHALLTSSLSFWVSQSVVREVLSLNLSLFQVFIRGSNQIGRVSTALLSQFYWAKVYLSENQSCTASPSTLYASRGWCLTNTWKYSVLIFLWGTGLSFIIDNWVDRRPSKVLSSKFRYFNYEIYPTNNFKREGSDAIS